MTALLGLDNQILAWIQVLKCGFLDVMMPVVSLFGEKGAFFIAIAVILMLFKKTRKAGMSLGLSLLFGLILCNGILKPGFYRARPFMSCPDYPLLIKPLYDGSFPSGHATASFEFAFVMMKFYRKWGIAALVLAFLIAFSRLYLFVHYPSDVLCGILVGLFCGFAGCAVISFMERKIREKKQIRNN